MEINKVVQFLQQPQVNFDIWRIIDAVMELFDKRVGLSELLYGMNPGGTQLRTASDVQAKQQAASIRPDWMSSCVEAWQTEAARAERFVAYWEGVSASDVTPLFGSVQSQLWDQLVMRATPESILHETACTVEAHSARKPNKDREQASITAIAGPFMNEWGKHADVTGDTSQLNWLVEKWGDTMDLDTSGAEMGPRVPPEMGPDPQAQAEQQMETAEWQQQMQQSAAEHDQEMRQDREKHQQEMTQDAEEHRQDILQKKAQARLQRIQARKPEQEAA
jgi:hypothetical protein